MRNPVRPLVFVLMSQRSGTSALVHTLNEHRGFCVGIERYKYRWPDWPEAYDPALFERERFLDLRAGDTNIRDTERWDKYYARFARRWERRDGDVVSGDKVQPITAHTVRGILEQSPQAVFLYPFRSLLPLASSYKVRATDGADDEWAETHDQQAALDVWGRDNRAVLGLLDEPDLAPRVLPIAYEDFLGGDAVTVRAVLELLDVEADQHFTAAVEANAQRYERVQQKQLALTYREVEQLLPHVHDHAYVSLLARAPASADRLDVTPDAVVRRLEDQLRRVEEQHTRLRQRRVVRLGLRVASDLDRARTAVRGVLDRGAPEGRP